MFHIIKISRYFIFETGSLFTVFHVHVNHSNATKPSVLSWSLMSLQCEVHSVIQYMLNIALNPQFKCFATQ